MKKLMLSAAVVVAFSVSSVFAGPCPGGGCGSKDKDDVKDTTDEAAMVEVAL
jgi:hypothetical protein